MKYVQVICSGNMFLKLLFFSGRCARPVQSDRFGDRVIIIPSIKRDR